MECGITYYLSVLFFNLYFTSSPIASHHVLAPSVLIKCHQIDGERVHLEDRNIHLKVVIFQNQRLNRVKMLSVKHFPLSSIHP